MLRTTPPYPAGWQPVGGMGRLKFGHNFWAKQFSNNSSKINQGLFTIGFEILYPVIGRKKNSILNFHSTDQILLTKSDSALLNCIYYLMICSFIVSVIISQCNVKWV